jgi:hydroxysqualene synthase
MKPSAQLRSGKSARDENFPVASWLIRREHRADILAFYQFVRVADDIADHRELSAEEKLARLDRLEQSLTGCNTDEPEGVSLSKALLVRGLSSVHAIDLLKAFRQDVRKTRYRDWDDLIAYCSLSAMPVGRFVLDVHGEDRGTWPFSDALCTSLQIINHLQDCGADYRNLDRVYLPLAMLSRFCVSPQALGAPRSTMQLKECLNAVTMRTGRILQQSLRLPFLVRDTRLALEIATIQELARRLLQRLQSRDPLSEPVHLTPAEMTMIGARGALLALFRRAVRTTHPRHS